MKSGDYVELVRAVPRWPRKTRGTVVAVNSDGWLTVDVPYPQATRGYARVFLHTDEVVRLLRREETSGIR
jgi:hypothetical protein